VTKIARWEQVSLRYDGFEGKLCCTTRSRTLTCASAIISNPTKNFLTLLLLNNGG
jgi:hypothetical protein